MSFGAWLKEARESANPSLSQEECAKRARVSQAQWAKWESLKGQPRVESVRKAAEAVNRSFEEAMSVAFPRQEMEVPPEWAALWHRTPADRRARLMKATRGVQEAIASF